VIAAVIAKRVKDNSSLLQSNSLPFLPDVPSKAITPKKYVTKGSLNVAPKRAPRIFSTVPAMKALELNGNNEKEKEKEKEREQESAISNSVEPDFPEPNQQNDDSRPTNESPNSAVPPLPMQFLKAFHWQFKDLNVLLGSNLMLFCTNHLPAVSLRLQQVSAQFDKSTCLDYWLDNVLANAHSVTFT